jgi:aminoglycoside phosphotransferase (APT) family kinase protein
LDGPCIIHRDFRPGNMIIHQNTLRGIIDWSSARSSLAEEDFCSIEHGEWGDFNGYKNVFLDGYRSIRTVPSYNAVITLLRQNTAIAVIGFTGKRNTWNNMHARPYIFNRKYMDMLDCGKL